MLDNFRKTLSNLIAPAKNAMSLPNQFLRYGNREVMTPDWTHIAMSDKDLYVGYAYAAIRNRANSVARLAKTNIITESEQDDLVHPYLTVINDSPTFTNNQFWQQISTYIDLEGVYYLMAIRAIGEDSVGAVQEFKLLNSYHITRLIDEKTMEVVGYQENRNGYVRVIEPEMIIEMRDLNPFDDNKPYSMTDAAKESQFILKTSGDYTRHALRNNINAPGVMSTDVILDEKDFRNFKERVVKHTKGEPIFANGKGAVTWESMQTELKGAALDTVNEINRDSLLAVSGTSKTILGIEQSGTTRETANVQKDLYTENQILPRVQMIIDALNQDYENNYPSEFERTGATIVATSPLEADHDANLKETEVLQKQSDLYADLIAKGYDSEIAAQYVNGEITIDQLGEPTNPPVEETTEENKLETEKNQATIEEEKEEVKSGTITQQEGSLRSAIVNIDQKLVAESINKVTKAKNQFEDEFDVIGKRDKNRAVRELEAALIGFYGVVIGFGGSSSMNKRVTTYAMPGTFKLNNSVKRWIKDTAKKVANSHIDTVVNDILVTAQSSALAGDSLDQTAKKIKDKYNETISENRAKTISRTETNRAFTRSQYEADVQFIKQNKLEGRVFKQWRTRSDDPCEFCLQLEAEGPIPFGKNFRNLGDTVTADGNTLDVNFESLSAGNAHPNCSCEYELIVKDAENYLTEKSEKKLKKVLNEIEKSGKKLEQSAKKNAREIVSDAEKEAKKLTEDLEKIRNQAIKELEKNEKSQNSDKQTG